MPKLLTILLLIGVTLKTYRHRTVGGANGWAERRCLYCECLCHQCLYFLCLILLLHVFSANKLHPASMHGQFMRLLISRDVPDIQFRLAGYPSIFSSLVLVPAKTVPGTGYLSRIVLGPFWQLVELSSPSEWAPYCKTVGLHDSLVVSHVDQLFYIY